MKRVIDIPENWETQILNMSDSEIMDFLYTIVRNGTPLPKGCGRLVDADRLEQIQTDRLQDGEIKIWELKLITSALDAAETVVEADGGAE